MLALVFDWIITVGNSSIASSEDLPKMAIVPPTCYIPVDSVVCFV